MPRRNAKPQGIAAKHASRPDVRDALMLAAWEKRLGVGYAPGVKCPVKGYAGLYLDANHVSMALRVDDPAAEPPMADVVLSADVLLNASRWLTDVDGPGLLTLHLYERDYPAVLTLGRDHAVVVAPRTKMDRPNDAHEATEEAKELKHLLEAALAYGRGDRGAAAVARLLNSAEAYARLHPKAVPA